MIKQNIFNNKLELDDDLNQEQKDAVQNESTNIVITAPAGSGKALKNGTGVLTDNGYVPIEKLAIGDLVFAEDGKLYPVLGVYPQGQKQVYKMIFSDDSIIECSPDHLWSYQTAAIRQTHKKNYLTNTTEEISKMPLKVNSHWNIYIPMTEPIQFTKKTLPIDPYLLGAFLGDGCLSQRGISFSNSDTDIIEKVRGKLQEIDMYMTHTQNYDYYIKGNDNNYGYNNMQSILKANLRELKLTGCNSEDKFVPEIYKFSSVEDRLELIKGIIDTDGSCTGSAYDIALKSKQLILDIKFILETLGITANYSEKKARCSNAKKGYNDCGTVYRLYIKTSNLIPKIHSSLKRESQWKKGQTSARRTLREIIKTEEKSDMTCIEVGSPNHLFITENCIVTHNTKTLINAIVNYRFENMNDRICAITYTRAARAEMEYRLAQMGVLDAEVTTIHVWSRNILTELSKKYDFKIKILEEPAIKQILRELVRDSNIKLNVDILYTYINGNKKMEVSDNYLRALEIYNRKYIAYKRTNGLYDFTDYPLYLLDKLNTYNEVITTIDALFVDELQDVDEEQFEIFQKVICDKKFYIGDAWQSIYVFRGADMRIFQKLKDFTYLSLKYNYRSYQEIIDYATTVYLKLKSNLNLKNLLISNICYSNPSSIACTRGTGGMVATISPFGELTDISCNNMFSNKEEAYEYFWSLKPMILCRTNKQVKAIEEFSYFNVSTVHQAKGLEYNNVIVIDDVITDLEDLNIAYVAITRAKNNVLVSNFQQFYRFLQKTI